MYACVIRTNTHRQIAKLTLDYPCLFFLKRDLYGKERGFLHLYHHCCFLCMLSGTYFMAATCVKSQISKVNLDFATYVAAAEY